MANWFATVIFTGLEILFWKFKIHWNPYSAGKSLVFLLMNIVYAVRIRALNEQNPLRRTAWNAHDLTGRAQRWWKPCPELTETKASCSWRSRPARTAFIVMEFHSWLTDVHLWTPAVSWNASQCCVEALIMLYCNQQMLIRQLLVLQVQKEFCVSWHHYNNL